jgi:predicted transcriptional regulator
MKIAIETGKSTVQSIVDYLRKTADLTDAQIKRLESIQLIEQQSDDNFFGEGE